jgi:hypothetical protein
MGFVCNKAIKHIEAAFGRGDQWQTFFGNEAWNHPKNRGGIQELRVN